MFRHGKPPRSLARHIVPPLRFARFRSALPGGRPDAISETSRTTARDAKFCYVSRSAAGSQGGEKRVFEKTVSFRDWRKTGAFIDAMPLFPGSSPQYRPLEACGKFPGTPFWHTDSFLEFHSHCVRLPLSLIKLESKFSFQLMLFRVTSFSEPSGNLE